MLDDFGLVIDQTLVANDVNHYKIYESNFESTVISLKDDEYKVGIYRDGNLPTGSANFGTTSTLKNRKSKSGLNIDLTEINFKN